LKGARSCGAKPHLADCLRTAPTLVFHCRMSAIGPRLEAPGRPQCIRDPLESEIHREEPGRPGTDNVPRRRCLRCRSAARS
jgi:hypothetical protein